MKRMLVLFCCALFLLAACSPSRQPFNGGDNQGQASALPPSASSTPRPTPSNTPEPSETPSLTPTATFGVGSQVRLAQDTVCRMGPGESYYEVVPAFAKDKMELRGRNEKSEWVLVQGVVPSDPECWIPTLALAPLDGLLAGVQLADYPALPAAPVSITAPRSVCGVASRPLVVAWSPVSSDVQYHLYRNGKLISTQSGGSFYDLDVPKPQRPVVYVYTLQSFNDYAVSPQVLSVSVSVCAK